MNYKFSHNNINVRALDKSISFYKEALNLSESLRIDEEAFTLVYLVDGVSSHKLELTYLKNRKTDYNLGDNEFHIAFETDNYQDSYNHHKKMDCICYENEKMGIYFIKDPDGYWIEILPEKML